jgi:hypothetical protein
MPDMTGRCLCGLVRFTATDVETHHHACHCGTCRRWTGGPFFAAVAKGMEFEGEGPGRYRSSEWAERGFCRNCGGHLFYRLLGQGLPGQDLYAVSVGAFDDANAFKLALELYYDAKPPGYAFAGDQARLSEADTIRKFTGQ